MSTVRLRFERPCACFWLVQLSLSCPVFSPSSAVSPIGSIGSCGRDTSVQSFFLCVCVRLRSRISSCVCTLLPQTTFFVMSLSLSLSFLLLLILDGSCRGSNDEGEVRAAGHNVCARVSTYVSRLIRLCSGRCAAGGDLFGSAFLELDWPGQTCTTICTSAAILHESSGHSTLCAALLVVLHLNEVKHLPAVVSLSRSS
jgi:hypothetical protein